MVSGVSCGMMINIDDILDRAYMLSAVGGSRQAASELIRESIKGNPETGIVFQDKLTYLTQVNSIRQSGCHVTTVLMDILKEALS
jgi:dTDP-D-glucose 4,6-dehydratase